MFIIFSAMLGVGVLSMASDLCKHAQQNGWHVIFIGCLYPLFIVITAAFIDRKTNHAKFEEINERIYGKILTKVFFVIFFLYFITVLAAIASGYANVLVHTLTRFLNPVFIIVPSLILITLISIQGIFMVGRICEFYFYITLPLLIITLGVVHKGSLSNVMPIFFSFDQIKAVPSTFFAFSGCEISYFIINKISNGTNTKKAGIIATLILTLLYLLNVFMVIYTLGWEFTSILKTPLLYLIQIIEIPLISNFLSIVIFLWSTIIFKSLLAYNYTASSIFSNVFKIDYKIANYILFFIVLFYTYFMIPEYNRVRIINTIMPYFIGFSFSWASITTILIAFKYRSENNEITKM